MAKLVECAPKPAVRLSHAFRRQRPILAFCAATNATQSVFLALKPDLLEAVVDL